MRSNRSLRPCSRARKYICRVAFNRRKLSSVADDLPRMILSNFVRGFDVSLEKTVLDGYGFVDAVLTRHNMR